MNMGLEMNWPDPDVTAYNLESIKDRNVQLNFNSSLKIVLLNLKYISFYSL